MKTFKTPKEQIIEYPSKLDSGELRYLVKQLTRIGSK